MPADRPLHVLIAGGGVAAVECLLGLHELAGDRVHVTLLSDAMVFDERAVALAEPFGYDRAQHVDLPELASRHGAAFVHGWVELVDPVAHVVTTREETRLPYDVLVLATGAATRLPWGHADLLGVAPERMVDDLRSEIRGGGIRRVVVAIPDAPHWPLPGYELALLLARDPGLPTLEITLVTAEPQPLRRFGARASAAIAHELDDAGVRLVCGQQPEVAGGTPDLVTLRPSGEAFEADRVIAIPDLLPHALGGLPTDARGFLPVDAHGRVRGADDVYAAGDCTDFALKHGGLAAQEADAVALEIARRAGAEIPPQPREVVLQARLLTGSGALWMRRDLLTPDDPGEVATHALWAPSGTLAGRWLAPFLAARRDAPIAP